MQPLLAHPHQHQQQHPHQHQHQQIHNQIQHQQQQQQQQLPQMPLLDDSGDLFNFYEVFGDADDALADPPAPLLSADDQSLFAQFLDALAPASPAPVFPLPQHPHSQTHPHSQPPSQPQSPFSLKRSIACAINPDGSTGPANSLGLGSLTIPMDSHDLLAQNMLASNVSSAAFPKRLKSSPTQSLHHPLASSAPPMSSFAAFYHAQNAQAPKLDSSSFSLLHRPDGSLLAQQLQQQQQQQQQNQMQQHFYGFHYDIPTNMLHYPMPMPQAQQQQHPTGELSPPVGSFSSPVLSGSFQSPTLAVQHPVPPQQQAPQGQSQQMPLPQDSHHSTSPVLALSPAPAGPKKRGRKPKNAVTPSTPTVTPPLSAASTTISTASVSMIGESDTTTSIQKSRNTTASTGTTTKQPKSLLTQTEKKANHIQAEQRRRMMIREALKELSTLVPGLRPPIEGDCSVEGSSRVEILEATRMFVEKLRQRNQALRGILTR